MAWYSKWFDFEIDKSQKSTTMNNLSKRTGKPQWIVVHYTGNGHGRTKGAALANCMYFNRADRQASADFFIDNTTIARYNPNCAKYYSWHCGGGAPLKARNCNSIGIEVVSDGEAFTAAEKRRLRWLVCKLMAKYGIKPDHVIRHYDCNSIHKLCPYPYTGTAEKNKKWVSLHSHITEGE